MFAAFKGASEVSVGKGKLLQTTDYRANREEEEEEEEEREIRACK